MNKKKNKTNKLRIRKKFNKKTILKMIGGEIIEYDDGNKYEGDVVEVNGVKIKQGNGKITYSKANYIHDEGDTYEGEFFNDKANGKGKYTYANQDTYEGDFLNDMAHGKGIFIFADDGTTYEGDFVRNYKQGKGTYTYPNRDKYEGDFFNDTPNGRGIYTTANGNVYEIGYKNGKKHGKRKLINETRDKDDITCWENGTRIFVGEIQDENDKECEDNEDIIDPISMEKIPKGKGFRIYTDTINNCYNMDNIKALRRDSDGYVTSPLTRKVFNDNDMRRKKLLELCYGGGKSKRLHKRGKTNRRKR